MHADECHFAAHAYILSVIANHLRLDMQIPLYPKDRLYTRKQTGSRPLALGSGGCPWVSTQPDFNETYSEQFSMLDVTHDKLAPHT